MDSPQAQHVFVAGICGTFMAGLALLARELGARVTGCDANVYPPMSDQLRAAGIEVLESYSPDHLKLAPDVVIVGNALSRGNPLVEYLLDSGVPYTSGPQWLWENVLQGRHVLAVSGTHGKTTTSSLLAWVLDRAGTDPGFLIGGIPSGFGCSARLGTGEFFVIEADEYDTAFFDKRSKFVHYRPRTLIINNIEYDHADIFPDLDSIQRQFHHLIRIVPPSGLVVHPASDTAVDEVLAKGLWSRSLRFGVDEEGADVSVTTLAPDASRLRLCCEPDYEPVEFSWALRGRHNAANAAAAASAALDAGISPAITAAALSDFPGVRRRLEIVDIVDSVTVYDDFAHHPTAIAATLQGLRAGEECGRIIAVIEPRSNTMRLGVHRAALPEAVADADRVYWFQPAGAGWDMEKVADESNVATSVHATCEEIVRCLAEDQRPGDRIVVMSNGGFEGIHHRIVTTLRERKRVR